MQEQYAAVRRESQVAIIPKNRYEELVSSGADTELLTSGSMSCCQNFIMQYTLIHRVSVKKYENSVFFDDKD